MGFDVAKIEVFSTITPFDKVGMFSTKWDIYSPKWDSMGFDELGFDVADFDELGFDELGRTALEYRE